ncbi:MAG: Alanine racemase 1 [Candidatus Anoxychlamydiales bacterium]|nr:Alanine racemase 1 [Candidatus Anoxychlamydiales bacterium]NGX41263.1 Alanine racemase 1 [Candidatus Anoxychlamydiales bacterium]HEU64139.1 alanine racemase [Chlamydiota bacterium]
MLNYSSWIEIDLKQFKKNILLIRSYIKDTLFCLCVKANAYGHGLIEIAKVAERECVDYLAVANLMEGIKLREANIKLPILVLGTFHEDQIKDLIDNDLEITISSFFKAKLVQEYSSKHNKKSKIHLKVDTGMGRIGVKPNTAISLYKYLKDQKCFIVKGIFSHLACADQKDHPINIFQIKTFDDFLNKIKPDKSTILHIANSAYLCNFENDLKDMVRLGALPFGCYSKDLPEKFESIKSIFSVKSKVSYFKIVEKDQGISYGYSFITKAKSRVVTIPVGYGDGYSRSLSNIGSVLIRGKKFPIIGTVCMDQFMVDVSKGDAYIGDEVVLIGRQKNKEITIKEIATNCKTISYEILCSFNERLPRVYKD